MKVKVCVLLASVLVSTLMLPVATAGAATGTVCKTDTGSETFSPTLPRPPKSLTTTIHAKGRFGGCNNGVTGGSWSATTKLKNVNCGSISASRGVTNETITWKPGHNESAASSKLRLVTDASSVNQAVLTGSVTSGRFQGTKVTIHWKYVSISPKGWCATAGLKAISFKQGSSRDHI
jgi:hypothetical protein